MAAFIAKGIVAPAGGSAIPVSYGPDSVTGRSYSCDAGNPSLSFTDVPPQRFLQARPLPLGQGNHCRLRRGDLLPDGRSHARSDGQVPGQRVPPGPLSRGTRPVNRFRSTGIRKNSGTRPELDLETTRVSIGEPSSCRREVTMRGRSISLTLLLVLVTATFLSGGCKCRLLPVGLEIDPSLTGNSDADGMLEPFETVVVEPTWQQKVTGPCTMGPHESIHCTGSGDFTCKTNLTETGTPVSLTGPAGSDYVVQNSPTTYGPMGFNGTRTGAYAIFVSAPAGRPAAALGRHFHREPDRNLAGVEELDDPRRRQLLGRAAHESLLQEGRDAVPQRDHGRLRPGRVLSGRDSRSLRHRGVHGARSRQGRSEHPGLGSRRNAALQLCGGRRIALLRRSSDRPVLQALPLPGGAERDAAVWRRPSNARRSRSRATRWRGIVARAMVAPEWRSLQCRSTYGPDPVTGLSYSCNAGEPRDPLHRRRRLEPVVPARALPLGQRRHRGLRPRHILSPTATSPAARWPSSSPTPSISSSTGPRAFPLASARRDFSRKELSHEEPTRHTLSPDPRRPGRRSGGARRRPPSPLLLPERRRDVRLRHFRSPDRDRPGRRRRSPHVRRGRERAWTASRRSASTGRSRRRRTRAPTPSATTAAARSRSSSRAAFPSSTGPRRWISSGRMTRTRPTPSSRAPRRSSPPTHGGSSRAATSRCALTANPAAPTRGRRLPD